MACEFFVTTPKHTECSVETGTCSQLTLVKPETVHEQVAAWPNCGILGLLQYEHFKFNTEGELRADTQRKHTILCARFYITAVAESMDWYWL